MEIFHIRNIKTKSEYDESLGRTRYYVEGHITTDDMDKVDDILTKGCIDDIKSQFNESVIKLDYDHETMRNMSETDESGDDLKFNMSKMPLGKAIDNKVTTQPKTGNYVQFELNPHWKQVNKKGEIVRDFQEVWDAVKSGFYDAFSIAYSPVKTAYKNMKDKTARLLDKVDIFNVALTGNPVNPNATMANAMAKSLNHIKSKEDENLKSDSNKTKEESTMPSEDGNKEGQSTQEYVDKKSYEERMSKVEEQLKSISETLEKFSKESEKKSDEEGNDNQKDQKSEDNSKENKSEEKEETEVKSRLDKIEQTLGKFDKFLNQTNYKSQGAEDKSQVADQKSGQGEEDSKTLSLI